MFKVECKARIKINTTLGGTCDVGDKRQAAGALTVAMSFASAAAVAATLYGVGTYTTGPNEWRSEIHEVDPSSGASRFVSRIDASNKIPLGIASSRRGVMYGIMFNDSDFSVDIDRIDPLTGRTENLSRLTPSEDNSFSFQGLTWDGKRKRLLSVFEGRALTTINPSNGRWRVGPEFTWADSGEAVTGVRDIALANGRLHGVTSGAILHIKRGSGETTDIVDAGFWGPNTLAYHDGELIASSQSSVLLGLGDDLLARGLTPVFDGLTSHPASRTDTFASARSLPAPVPLPATAPLLVVGIGMIALAVGRRQRCEKAAQRPPYESKRGSALCAT